MDKTVEIAIVAMVILVTATIVLFLLSNQAQGFDGWANSQQDNAQCSYYEERLARANQGSENAQNIIDSAPEECKPLQPSETESEDSGS